MSDRSQDSGEQPLTRVSQEKEAILELLRKNGFRITKQRKLILDIVFTHECTCCKEIYYEAKAKDASIGIATVYRMINTLTDLGVFRSAVPYNQMYQDSEKTCTEDHYTACGGCKVILENEHVVEFTDREWKHMLKKAVEEKGHSGNISCVLLKSAEGIN
ncbi:MAG: transcriptional repressor [Lachnospiraceae bacterium]|nr:transcriptional repressor [Lachnospiraceae bacterium]